MIAGFDIDGFDSATLAEDMGEGGDRTSAAVIPADAVLTAVMDTRDAVTVAGLPLAVVALIPGNDIAYWVSAVAGFGPAARVFQQLLVDPEVTSSLWAGIGLLAVIALVYGVVARIALGRRMHV